MVDRRAILRARSSVLLALPTLAVLTAAQPLTRKATTPEALTSYPVFFHGQSIVTRAQVVDKQELSWIAPAESRLLCLGCAAASGSNAPGGEWYEISGAFWDVGRLEPGDTRLASYDMPRLVDRLLGKAWPASGELLALVAEDVTAAEPPAAPTIRTVALEPQRYEDRQLTLTGRFRGRNLYGDLPEAPRQSRWDFVLQSADAAIWVTGLRPSGRDFSLDPSARVDTSRWLEVTGTIAQARGLVLLQATRIALARAPAEEPARVVVPPRRPEAPPEVVFSAPTADDVDVPRETTVRVQFSRDMDARSFRNSVRAGYVNSPDGVETPIALVTSYDEGNRVLEITFNQPLEPYRAVKVEILAEVAAHDAIPMGTPWSLTFTVGGS